MSPTFVERRCPELVDRSRRGFSLVELLIVIIIIMIMAAVALPSVFGYMRHYKIRGAAQQLSSELSAARLKAISRGGSFGVLLVIVSDQQYRWVLLDDPDFPGAVAPQTLGALMGQDDQIGPLRTLPPNVRFTTTGANTSAVGFTRLGSQCQAGAAPPRGCGNLTGGPGTNYVTFGAARTTITIIQDLSPLTRQVDVTPGGRVTQSTQ